MRTPFFLLKPSWLHSLLHFIAADWECRDVYFAPAWKGDRSRIKMRRCRRCGSYESWFSYDGMYTSAFQHQIRAWEDSARGMITKNSGRTISRVR